ncbi:MAG TPA: amino acid ABC transporter permease [Nocardioidaceae bacterium]|nr:amino acid ABC transporter permease [Nocardioidaceae bacterium]
MSSPAPGDGAPQQQGDRLERMSLAFARVPFQAKVAVVWLVIFAVLASFFWVAKFDLAWMQDKFTFILAGLRYTLVTAVLGIILAVLLAGIGALGRISRNPIAYGVSGFYVSFFRGTPLIVQMFLIYSALPQVGSNLEERFPGLGQGFNENFVLTALVAGILALGLNYGAYLTEIFRAGIQSVSGGQGEAADALGMTYGQKMRKVVLPQAFRVSIPPTGNEFIAMMKDTALVSFLGVALAQAEMFRRASYIGTSEFKSMEALLVAAGLYWTLTGIFTFFQRRLEARLERGYVRTAVGNGPTVTGQGH